MVCTQIQVYVVFLVLQTLFSVSLVGRAGIRIIGPAIFIGVLYLLCKYNHLTIANILIALNIGLALIIDVYVLADGKTVKHELYVKAESKHKEKKE